MKTAIELVRKRINSASERSGRSGNTVKLVAVSKLFPVSTIQAAYDCGQRVFGENRAQEFRDKPVLLPADIEWHFIGHLQTNKIKYVVPNADLLHSVDSLHLAKAISEYGHRRAIQCDILMEVNTSGESAKFGVSPDEAEELYLQLNELPAINPRGLMTIGPLTSDKGQIRQAFRNLKNIQLKIAGKVDAENISELSMGMSQDFEIAVEEGSTIVRIGTAIFGARGR